MKVWGGGGGGGRGRRGGGANLLLPPPLPPLSGVSSTPLFICVHLSPGSRWFTRLCKCASLLQLSPYLQVTECAGIWAWSELCIHVRLRVDLLSTLAHTKIIPDLHSLRFLELFFWKRERKCEVVCVRGARTLLGHAD